MKKIIFTSRLTLYLAILVLMVATFIFPSSVSRAAADSSFSFGIISPTNNQFVNSQTIKFSGTYSLDLVTFPDSLLTLSIKDNTDPANPIEVPTDGILINGDGTWSFNKDFTQGNHKITFTANDGHSTAISQVVTFTVDTESPWITDYKIISSNHVSNNDPWENSIIEDMTHVPLDAKIQITVKDNNNLTYKKASDGTYKNPITVKTKDGQNVLSEEDKANPPQPDANGNYIITFTPKTQLLPQTTYIVSITSNIEDESGNPVHVKTLKFTTSSGDDKFNPHGKYFSQDLVGSNGMKRSNLCASCHNTHTAAGKGLLGGNFIKDSTKEHTASDNTTNYCMACHDGTSASRVDNVSSTSGSAHDEYIDSKHLANEGSCSSCHDPHLDWSKENPNLLTSHFIFDHKKNGVTAPNAPQQISDSNNQMCESCHGDQTNSIKDKPGVEYKVLNDHKSTTRLGTIEDNNLCLRCHNANKLTNSDIQSLYENPNSKHNFASLDGSGITGNFPCAECHETHGSSNAKLLNTSLGQENQQSDFIASDWTVPKEREFCLKCHNGTTSSYGVTGKALDPALSVGHTNSQACSECHNDPSKTYKTFLESSLDTSHSPFTGHAPNLPTGS